MKQHTLDLWRNQARLYGTLTLSQANWDKLFSAAEIGVTMRDNLEGAPDAVIDAWTTPQPTPRSRRVREAEPV